jgi:hypothetical protein
VAAATSSRQIELEVTLPVVGELTAPFVRADSEITAYLANPVAYRNLVAFLATQLSLPVEQITEMLDNSRDSFLGVFQTLELQHGIEIATPAIAEFIRGANLDVWATGLAPRG